MANQSKRLGRGLSSLINSTVRQPGDSRSLAQGGPRSDTPADGRPTLSDSAGVAGRDEQRKDGAKTELRIPVVPEPGEGGVRTRVEESWRADFDSAARVRAEGDGGSGMGEMVAEMGQRAGLSRATVSQGGALVGGERWSKQSERATIEGGVARTTVLRVSDLVPRAAQPRQSYDEGSIAGLAKSIARSGVVQPLLVRPRRGVIRDGEAGYEIVAGERRWRAAGVAGVTHVPVVVREVAEEEALELALVENIQREDLNAIDRARAYEAYCKEFGLKPEEVAERLGEDRTTVVNYLRLLELPAQLKEMVARKELSMGHARCILGAGEAEARLELARAAVEHSLSVRALEDIVRRRKIRDGADGAEAAKGGAGVGKTGRAKGAHLSDLEQRLQQVVGTKITIREGRRRGQGRVIIEYYSFDDFERIAGLLGLGSEG